MSIYKINLEKNSANYTPLSPLSFLERSRKTFPELIALEYGNYKLNYFEAGKRVDALANLLGNYGVSKEDTVAVMLPNIPEMWECHFGVPMVGGVLNAINTRLDYNTIKFILEHGEAKVLIYDSAYSEIIEKAVKGLERNLLIFEVVDNIENHKRSIFAGNNNILDYNDEINKYYDLDFKYALPKDEWDAIALNYTSGTTGNPKGVVYHHRGAYLNAIGNTLVWEMPMFPKYLWTLPMFHCNGWCFPWTVTERSGTHVCLRQPAGDLIVNALLKYEITHLCGAPIIMQMIADYLIDKKIILPKEVRMMTAGAPPPEAVLNKMKTCGIDVIHVYGLTETYGPSVVCAWKEDWNKLNELDQAKMKARQGIPYSVQEGIKIVNPKTMKNVPQDSNTIGEVFLKGNITMKGYLKNETATKESFKDGWFHTGDLGVWHEDGYVQLKDRSKDIIISGGENISSIEVEDALYKHPDVLAVGVVAKKDEKWGETPCAFVELRKGSVATINDLRAHCKNILAGFKVPGEFRFIEIPKTSTGKIQKFKLREMLE